jgi:uncharacterized integral membrane protein
MSAFSLFALVLLAAVTLFALGNPTVVTLRFLLWQTDASVAVAVIGGAVFGGLLVFISSLIGQQQLRTRLRDLQARVREMEARSPGPGGPSTPPS